jgi:alpha-N-arabinofuranosidase
MLVEPARKHPWRKVQGDTWQVVLPNTFFGRFNPYADLIHGDWYKTADRMRHAGTVYVNGDWLTEARKQAEVMGPVGAHGPVWFGQVDANATTIWAQFPGVNPNAGQVEINVRQSVFYPRKRGISYLTVQG